MYLFNESTYHVLSGYNFKVKAHTAGNVYFTTQLRFYNFVSFIIHEKFLILKKYIYLFTPNVVFFILLYKKYNIYIFSVRLFLSIY